jgi:hypothetical protein
LTPLAQVLRHCSHAADWLQMLQVQSEHATSRTQELTRRQGMDGVIVFIDSCEVNEVKCDWKQIFKPAPMAPVVSNILHTTNQLNPLARMHAQQLVEELQHNPSLIRSACSLMLRLSMPVAAVLEEWRTHPDRHSDPLGVPCTACRTAHAAACHRRPQAQCRPWCTRPSTPPPCPPCSRC